MFNLVLFISLQFNLVLYKHTEKTPTL